MCYLPSLIHQLQSWSFHPPVRSTYQSDHFLATFQCQSHSGLRAKVLLRRLRNITIYEELYDIWSVLPAAWIGQVGAVRLSGVTQSVTGKQFGLVMTHARRACLFYSQRWCERDETESGWQGKEREQRHTGIKVFIHRCTHRQNEIMSIALHSL